MLDAALRTTSERRIDRTDEQQSGVPLALVHRARREDAFVTGWQRIGEGSFIVSGRLSGAHPFFPPVAGSYDPLLVAETMRQAGILIVHADYAIPLGYQFLLSEFRYTSMPELLRVDTGPADVEVLVKCSDIVWRGRRPLSMRIAMTVRRGGTVVARGLISTKFISPGIYMRLRGENATPRSWVSQDAPVMPLLAGRFRADDVVIAPTTHPTQWLLRVDTTHPTLFQGRKDHVPGMLLLEAARQVAQTLHAAEPFLPACGETTFHRYAEFTSPCLMRVERLSAGGGVRITGEQDGELVFASTLAERPPVVNAIVGAGRRA